MGSTLLEIVLLALAVAAGALIQGSIGFGLSLVAAPAFGLIEPTALPAALLFIAFPLTGWMAFRERRALDARGVAVITVGRLPGTAVAIWLLSVVTGSQISVLIGAVVLLAVALSAFVPEVETGTGLRMFAGVMSGLMGTIAAIGGPPLALAYQSRPGPELRSTLALSFVIGSVISLVALWATGHVDRWQLVLAAEVAPGMVLGLTAAAWLHRFLDRGWLRTAVLVFAAVSGVAAIARGIAAF